MPTFTAPDRTELAYREVGDGPPLVCVPGGPMQDSAYLGDLGGLSAYRRLILLDLRGTGLSAVPTDPTTYRADRQVADLEALRAHVGLERLDVLAHSAGANLALLYAERHPDRVAKLLLVTPSLVAAGITVSPELRRATAELRSGEPWFPDAATALTAIAAGQAGPDTASALAPLFHGRWDDAARDLHARQDTERNAEAAEVFGSAGAYDPARTRSALAGASAEVVVLAGEVDVNSPPAAVAELAGLFPRAEFVVQTGAGHYPWLDDADGFVQTMAARLG